MKRIAATLIATSALLLSACASVPMASLEEDSRAKAFTSLPDKATLYIYRHESFGGAIPMTVTVNGKALGQTAAQTYFRLPLSPGKYVIESHAENVSNLAVATEAGKSYYVWQEVKMGMWMARSLLQQVDEATGRAGVMASKLIASTVADGDLQPQDAAKADGAAAAKAQRLRELQNLRQEGLISEDEFQAKRRQLVDQL